MNTLNFPDCDEAAVATLAREIALAANTGECITLMGDLGAGKTYFSQHFIRTLCGDNTDVVSPTFMISQAYTTPHHVTISHYDLYRLEHTSELEEIGLTDTLLHHINLIEWPEIAEAYLPPDTLHILFAFGASPHYRDIAITGNTLWMTRLQRLHLLNR
jgi:N-acetylmuramate 1-kinase